MGWPDLAMARQDQVTMGEGQTVSWWIENFPLYALGGIALTVNGRVEEVGNKGSSSLRTNIHLGCNDRVSRPASQHCTPKGNIGYRRGTGDGKAVGGRRVAANNRVFLAYASNGSLLTANGHDAATRPTARRFLTQHVHPAPQLSRRRKRQPTGKDVETGPAVGRTSPQGVHVLYP